MMDVKYTEPTTVPLGSKDPQSSVSTLEKQRRELQQKLEKLKEEGEGGKAAEAMLQTRLVAVETRIQQIEHRKTRITEKEQIGEAKKKEAEVSEPGLHPQHRAKEREAEKWDIFPKKLDSTGSERLHVVA